MKIGKILMMSATLLVSLACSGNKSEAAKAVTKDNGKGKTLVVFFSHAGENYAVGNIEVGKDRDVEVSWLPLEVNMVFGNFESLLRIEKTSADTNQWRNVIFCLGTNSQTSLVVAVNVATNRSYVQTNLRLNSDVAC